MNLTRPIIHCSPAVPGWKCGEVFQPLPGPRVCSASPRLQSGFSLTRLCLCPFPHIFPAVGFHVCLLVPGCEGSWEVPAQAIFTQPHPQICSLAPSSCLGSGAVARAGGG